MAHPERTPRTPHARTLRCAALRGALPPAPVPGVRPTALGGPSPQESAGPARVKTFLEAPTASQPTPDAHAASRRPASLDTTPPHERLGKRDTQHTALARTSRAAVDASARRGAGELGLLAAGAPRSAAESRGRTPRARPPARAQAPAPPAPRRPHRLADIPTEHRPRLCGTTGRPSPTLPARPQQAERGETKRRGSERQRYGAGSGSSREAGGGRDRARAR